MQLHYDGAKVNLSAAARARSRAPIAQLRLRSTGNDGRPTHDHFSFHLGSRPPAPIRVIVSQASLGLVLLLQLHWSSSFRVCRLLRPPSIWDTSILLPFPASNSSACAGQAGLSPSYSSVVSAGTGPQQLAWSNCLIAIPDGSYQQPTSP